MQGRWGAEDEAGARNLIDAEATLRGISSVRTGQVISLAIEIEAGKQGPVPPMRSPVQHFMTRDGGDYAAGLPEAYGFGFADDVIMLATHGTTHIDALSHVCRGGLIYNGFSSNTITSRGAKRCGIDKLAPIVTRGIFVDLASPETDPQGEAIRRDQLEAAIARTGVAPAPGDALLVRTGWLSAWRRGQGDVMRCTGLHHDCAELILEAGFALVAADNVAVEVLPSHDPSTAVPLHLKLTWENGVYLAELFDLEELAQSGQNAFQLVIAPLRIKGGVGSPITPIAIL
ncbi:cyclase family protein [Rhodoligotrophos appendicifer]|uniref:cyclase family protein n=1 Tax=Rhodoligotrophos appendicifer TaxID=987056 RepID=UPI00195F69A8|nr:cyclase family protein [Rhodoligotrophos appendicifer]